MLVFMKDTMTLTKLERTALMQRAKSRTGRAEDARVRAHWAARAGLESAIARLGANMERAERASAFDALDDMAEVALGELGGASWSVTHETEERVVEGAADAHAKLNINRLSRESLLELDGMTEDMADSILDWIDEDDEPRELGAEEGYYASLPSPYAPRNLAFRSLQEVELAAGVTPELVRGEDWNLDGVLDPNEDDGDLSWPPDNADGVLDAGWSALVTASSVEPSRAASGEPLLDLKSATEAELLARAPTIDALQARTILAHALTEGARVEDFISRPLSQLAQQTGQPNAQAVRDLRDADLRLLLDEATALTLTSGPVPGRVNINTVSRGALERLTEVPPGLAEALLQARDARPTGYVHLMDLLEIQGVNRQRLVSLSRHVGVASGAYSLTSVGRDTGTGAEVRLSATLDASALPVQITEMRVR